MGLRDQKGWEPLPYSSKLNKSLALPSHDSKKNALKSNEVIVVIT